MVYAPLAFKVYTEKTCDRASSLKSIKTLKYSAIYIYVFQGLFLLASDKTQQARAQAEFPCLNRNKKNVLFTSALCTN